MIGVNPTVLNLVSQVEDEGQVQHTLKISICQWPMLPIVRSNLPITYPSTCRHIWLKYPRLWRKVSFKEANKKYHWNKQTKTKLWSIKLCNSLLFKFQLLSEDHFFSPWAAQGNCTQVLWLVTGIFVAFSGFNSVKTSWFQIDTNSNGMDSLHTPCWLHVLFYHYRFTWQRITNPWWGLNTRNVCIFHIIIRHVNFQ